MTELTLAKAQIAVNAALAYARENSLAPMTVAVLDDRGVLKAFAAEDGTPLRRADIAIGKAHGALAMGVNSRALEKRAQQQPSFIAAATQAVGGSLIPVPGGVLNSWRQQASHRGDWRHGRHLRPRRSHGGGWSGRRTSGSLSELITARDTQPGRAGHHDG